MNRYMSLVIFVAVVFGGGLLIGFVTLPGEWYAALTKPPFNPPNWIFGPVWSILYILISVAGWRIWPLEGAGTARRLGDHLDIHRVAVEVGARVSPFTRGA